MVRWIHCGLAEPHGIRTGQDKTCNTKRVSSIRRVNNIHGYLSADKDSPWRTMSEAAKELGVSNHVIRRLIKDGTLPAKQVVNGAPYQIRTKEIQSDEVLRASNRKSARVATKTINSFQCLQALNNELHNDQTFATERTARSAVLLSISRKPLSR